MKKNFASLTLLTLALLSLSSCGKESGGGATAPLGGGKPTVFETKEPQREDRPVVDELTGQFMAPLTPVNELVSGRVSGAVTLSRDLDEFIGDVRFNGGPMTAGVMHIQSVREGSRCPTEADDTNGDGFIDALEGEAVYGQVLIPLDADLNAQHLDLGTYPAADAFGGYIYSEVASFERFIKDLRETDLNPGDYLLKLNDDEAFKFAGKVVVIEGISREASLPPTVQATGRWDSHLSLPIACGVLKKITSTPGSIDRSEGHTPGTENPGGPAGEDDGAIIPPPEEN